MYDIKGLLGFFFLSFYLHLQNCIYLLHIFLIWITYFQNQTKILECLHGFSFLVFCFVWGFFFVVFCLVLLFVLLTQMLQESCV